MVLIFIIGLILVSWLAVGLIYGFWLAMAIGAGLMARAIAGGKNQNRVVVFAVVLILVAAGVAIAIGRIRVQAIDQLRLAEAASFCGARPLVLRAIEATDSVRFGAAKDNFPWSVKEPGLIVQAQKALSAQGERNVQFVKFERGQARPGDTYRVFQSIEHNYAELGVMDPSGSEMIAYAKYPRRFDTDTKHWYIGCNRAVSADGGDLEVHELFSLLRAVAYPTNTDARTNPDVRPISTPTFQ